MTKLLINKTFNNSWWFTILIGISIYLLFRDQDLVYNSIITFETPVNKKTLEFINKEMPLLIYSLPTGLWSMSFSQLIFSIRRDFTKKTILMSYSIFFLGFLWEVLQLNKLLAGTFDLNDIFFNLFFCTFSLIINFLTYEKL